MVVPTTLQNVNMMQVIVQPSTNCTQTVRPTSHVKSEMVFVMQMRMLKSVDGMAVIVLLMNGLIAMHLIQGKIN